MCKWCIRVGIRVCETSTMVITVHALAKEPNEPLPYHNSIIHVVLRSGYEVIKGLNISNTYPSAKAEIILFAKGDRFNHSYLVLTSFNAIMRRTAHM